MIMKILLSVILLSLLSLETYSQDGKPTPIRVTEGPMLGRPETHSMTIWVRTDRQGKVKVFYGKNADKLDQSASFETRGAEHDYTGTLTIDALEPKHTLSLPDRGSSIEGLLPHYAFCRRFPKPSWKPGRLVQFPLRICLRQRRKDRGISGTQFACF